MAGRRYKPPLMERRFSRLADWITNWTGSPWASFIAIAVCSAWLIGLPFAGLQNTTYGLAINTGTTIATFVMIFLLQHSSNKSSLAIHVKLDNILTRLDATDSALAGLEEQSEQSIREAQKAVRRDD